jgi:hypothetical protein
MEEAERLDKSFVDRLNLGNLAGDIHWRLIRNLAV